MDPTALISGLVGAAIGSITSLATLYINNLFQSRRESERLLFESHRDSERLLFENAYKDYELRILHRPENNQAPFPVILAYHKKVFDLIESGRLTPDAMKEVFDLQADLIEAVQTAVQARQTARPPGLAGQ